jgi:hypothetical protein
MRYVFRVSCYHHIDISSHYHIITSPHHHIITSTKCTQEKNKTIKERILEGFGLFCSEVPALKRRKSNLCLQYQNERSRAEV